MLPHREIIHKHFLAKLGQLLAPASSSPLWPIAPQRFRCVPLPPQGAQTQCVMALGQPPAFFVPHQRTVEKCRWRQAERAVKQDLPRRADQQISPAHNLGDAHRRVIHHTGQLIRRDFIATPQDKISKILSGRELLLSIISVHERNRFAVRDAETPGEFTIYDFGFDDSTGRCPDKSPPRHRLHWAHWRHPGCPCASRCRDKRTRPPGALPGRRGKGETVRFDCKAQKVRRNPAPPAIQIRTSAGLRSSAGRTPA